MAEAVGLAGSIAGLVTIAFQVSKAGYEYIGSVKNAQADVKELFNEISSLKKILEPLQKPEEASKLADTPESDPAAPLLAECERFLVKLNDGLQPKGRSQRLFGTLRLSKNSLKWPFKEKETRKGLDMIQRLKGTVVLKLQMSVITHLWFNLTVLTWAQRRETADGNQFHSSVDF